MIDPTWGAGYISDEQFVKKADPNQFMVDPNQFIKSHIPFDPLWQFLDYPLTKQDFRDKIYKSKTKDTYFNFEDSLKEYEKQNKYERLYHSIQRIEANGVCNYLVYDYLFHQKINYKEIDDKVYNLAFRNYNDGIFLANEYVNYANSYYRPYKSDEEIRKMLENIGTKYTLSKVQLSKIKDPTTNLAVKIEQLNRFIYQAENDLKKLQENLEKYLIIAKEYRENMAVQNEK
jgi:hypothetical protein